MGAGGGGGLDFLSGGGGGKGGGGFDPTGGLFGGGGGGFDPTGGLFSGPGFDPTSLFSGYNNPLSALGMGTGGAYPTTPQVTSTGDVTTQAADPNQQLGTPQNQQQPNVPLPRPDPRTQQPDVPLPRPDPRTPQGPTGFEPLPEGDATKSPAYQTLPGRGPFPGQPGYTPPVATDLPARGPFPGQPGYIPPTMQPLGGSPPYHTHIPLTDPVTGQPTGQNITDEGQYGAPIISAQAPFDPSNPDYQPKFNPAGYTPSTTGAAPPSGDAATDTPGDVPLPRPDPRTQPPETTGAAPAAGGVPDATGAGTPPTGAPPGTAAPPGAAPGQQQPDIIHQLLGNSPLGQIIRQFLPMLLGGRGIPGIGGGLPLGMPGYLSGMRPGPGIFNQPFRPYGGGGFPGGGEGAFPFRPGQPWQPGAPAWQGGAGQPQAPGQPGQPGQPPDPAQGGVPLPRPRPEELTQPGRPSTGGLNAHGAGDPNAGVPAGQAATPAPQGVSDYSGQSGLRAHGQMQQPRGMVIHHTNGHESVGQLANVLRQRGLGVQYFIDRNGQAWRMSPDNAIMYHTKNGGTGTIGSRGAGLGNQNMIGVEVAALNDRDVTPAQRQAATNLVGQLGQKYGFNPQTSVYGHGELNGDKERDEGMSIVNGIRSGSMTAQAGAPSQTMQAIQRGMQQGQPPMIQGGNPQLYSDRSGYAQQLQGNPQLREKVLNIMANEAGDNPRQAQAVAESMMNRASVRGTSLEQQAGWHGRDRGGYYATGSMGRGMNRPVMEQALNNALGGSNTTNYATDNSSGKLAVHDAQRGRFTHAASIDGEHFFSPGHAEAGFMTPWRNWSQRMGSSAVAGREPWQMGLAF